MNLTILRFSLYPIFFLLFSTSLFFCTSSPTESGPDQALSSFQIAEGFQIELVASEPLISDPVAMEIDENGHIWVVEMHGYPLDVSGSGVIKQLIDDDGDGWPDRSEVFYDGLILPTGIMRWKNGFIVTDAPDVLYLEDTDKDGRADLREVLLTGFARSNPQHNLNSPRFELDNWIYLGHEGEVGTERFANLFGDEGAEIRFPGRPESPYLPPNANGRMVRFDPDRSQVEMLSGKTQYNYSFGPYGHLLNCSNFHYLHHEVFAARYLNLNEQLLLDETMQYLPENQAGTEVFPVTESPEHQLLTDVGVMTSGCGVNWYKGGLFPEPYDQVSFVAEPVHNLVHTDILMNAGASFRAKSQFEQAEFLASTDAWFRPVNFYTGPDGALYIMDYYREYIEHPEWMSDEVNSSGALYNGRDKGRIYRVTPKGTGPMTFTGKLQLGAASDSALVAHLADPNIWWRRHAQRLLISEHSVATIDYLEHLFASTASPVGRVHALWTLHRLEGIKEGILEKGLKDPDPGVRENAVRVSEMYLSDYPGLGDKLVALKDDPDAKVRFQTLCTLGLLKGNKADRARETILLRDLDDEWIQVAALAGASGREVDLYMAVLQGMMDGTTPAGAEMLERICVVTARRNDPASVKRLFDQAVLGVNPENAWYKAATLRGLSQGINPVTVPETISGYGNKLAKYFAPETPPVYRTACLDLMEQLGKLNTPSEELSSRARQAALDKEADVSYRTDAIRMLGDARHQELLRSLIQPGEAFPIQQAVLQKLGAIRGTEIIDFLLEKWPSMTPELRNEAVEVFMKGADRRLRLLDAVDAGKIDPSSIGWRRTVSLLNEWNEAVRSRAREVLEGNETGREEVAEAYQKALALEGDAASGAQVFKETCAQCHQVNGAQGIAIGPDLASIRNRTESAILNDIIQPNQSIADGYEFWVLTQKDGVQISGIIAGESTVAITLRDLAGEEHTVARSNLASIEAQALSAMPNGLEAQINEQAMADLLAFLKGKGKREEG